jgi:hypothetical protein
MMALAEFGSTTHAQNRQMPLTLDRFDLVAPTVVAGPDVGFRILRWDGQIPVGQVVVKVDGVWQDAEVGK